MSLLANTRMGEVFASLEARNPAPGSPEYDADILQAQRMVASAYFLDVLLTAVSAAPPEKRGGVMLPTMRHFLQFLSLVSPAMFANEQEVAKTKAAISMVIKDMRDMSARMTG